MSLPGGIISCPVFCVLVRRLSWGWAVDRRLMVKYRDFRFIVPFIVQFWPLHLTGRFSKQGRSRAISSAYALNPMAGVIDGFRWCILGGQSSIYGRASRLPLLTGSSASDGPLVFQKNRADLCRRHLSELKNSYVASHV